MNLTDLKQLESQDELRREWYFEQIIEPYVRQMLDELKREGVISDYDPDSIAVERMDSRR